MDRFYIYSCCLLNGLTLRDFRRRALSFDSSFSRLENIIEGLNWF